MPANVRALIVVLLLSVVGFLVAKPVALKFTDAADFARRRNVWFTLTIIGFLSPSFWLFTLLAAPILVWAGRKDTNPIALFLLLLQVIPPISIDIPIVGINKLFALDMYRLLSLCVLLPCMFKLRRSGSDASVRGLGGMDLLVLGFGVLQVLLFVRPDTKDAAMMHDSLTNIIRRGFLYFLDVYLLYFVVSRSCSRRKVLVDAMAAYCTICVIMAPMAIFESLWHWLLYLEMGQGWGNGAAANDYLMRAGGLRAVVASGNSLALGFMFAIALGFWLYLQRQVSLFTKMAVTTLLSLGLIAAYARGPWVGAIIICFIYSLLGPRALARLLKTVAVGVLCLGVLLVSPLGERIAKVVPFLGGQVDYFNIEYREVLAARSLDIIQQHPLLGDQNAYAQLQDLRQGAGVIDFVNTYADIAVFYGLLGLALFVGVVVVGGFKAYRASRRAKRADPDLSHLGASLVACIVGMMAMIYTSSFMYGYAELYYVLAGMAAGYTVLGTARRRLAAAGAAVPVMASGYAMQGQAARRVYAAGGSHAHQR